MRRLIPDVAETTVAEQVGGLDLAALAGPERPYVVTNFVLTVDGRATIAGRSGPIGSDADTAMLVALRTRADALMIGAGTMRAERYGRPLPDPAKRERREREGMAPDPLMVLVSGRLDLPWDAPLFAEPEARVVVCTASAADPPETTARVDVIRHPDGVDLGALLGALRTDHDVRSVLSEGGPHLHGQLLDQGLVDELFVTTAAKLGGGDGPGLAEGMPEVPRPLELAWLLHEEQSGELFARYRVRHEP
jgi:riboflavin-specific deaminase-like protein